MSKNVQQSLAPKLEARLVDNRELCNFCMAIMGRMIVMAAQRGKPIEGVKIAAPEMDERRITAKVSFYSLQASAPAMFGSSGGDFRAYASGKSIHMARAMEKNPEFERFFEAVLRRVEGWCEQYGRDFRTLKVWKAFVTPDDVVVLHLGSA